MAVKWTNPNVETEEERALRVRAEQIAGNSASDAEISAAQKQYDQAAALRDREGPKGRRVGSRNTFVAAHPLEQLGHVWASKVRGDTAKGKEEDLATVAAKGRMGAAMKQAKVESVKDQELEIKETNSKNLGEYYEGLDENQKNNLALNQRKQDEAERKNLADETFALAELQAEGEGFSDMTASELKEVTAAGGAVRGVNSAGLDFQDTYARPVGGMPVISDPLGKLMSTTGIGGEDIDKAMVAMGREAGAGQNMADAVRWLARWQHAYTLAQRNVLFGATLTKEEDKAWKAAGEINLNMSADEIRSRVAQAEAIMAEKMVDRYATGIVPQKDGKAFNPQLYEAAMPGIGQMYADRQSAMQAAAQQGTGQGVQQPGVMPQQQPSGPQPIIQGGTPEEKNRQVIWGQF